MSRTSVRSFVQSFIRSQAPIPLSTGAYGDEGEILLEIDMLMHEAASGRVDSHKCMAASWFMNSPVALVGKDALDGFAYLASTIVSRTRPMRLAMHDCELRERRDALYMAVTGAREALGAPQGYLAVYQRYDALLNERRALRVKRGGEEWRSLQALDLLWVLAPFLIEEDPSEVQEGVGCLC